MRRDKLTSKEKKWMTYLIKKMEKGCGVALILIGVLTGVDTLMDSMISKVAYIVILLIIIIGLMYYLRKKCRK